MLSDNEAAWGGEGNEDPISLTIVMPLFITNPVQMERVLANLARWDMYPPCQGSGRMRNTAFIFKHEVIDGESIENTTKRKAHRKMLKAAWRNTANAVGCFGPEAQFATIRLKKAENIHPTSTCKTFYQTNEDVRGISEHWYQMEGDVLPIRAGWADELLRIAQENKGCSRFWQAGSMSKTRWRYARNDERIDWHLNGNSMYCVADGAFHTYLQRVKDFYPPLKKEKTWKDWINNEGSRFIEGCQTTVPEASGFDHTLYQYRMHPKNAAYGETIASRFLNMKFIANFGEDPYKEEDVRTNVDVFLVHSKAPSFSTLHSARVAAYWNILRDYAPPSAQIRTRFDGEPYLSLRDIPRLWRSLCKERKDLVVMDIFVEFFQSRCPQREVLGTFFADTKLDCATKCARALKKETHPNFHFAYRTITTQSEGMVPDSRSCLCYDAMCENPESDVGYNIYRTQPVPFPEECRQLDTDPNWQYKFPGKTFVWSTDMHPGPISCSVNLFEEIGGVVHAEIDFYAVFDNRIRKKDLKVLNIDSWRGFGLEPCPKLYRERFYQAYKNDPEMNRVDVIICSHPAANCELYMPWAASKLLIVYPSTRLEFGRNDDVVDWRKPYLHNGSDTRWLEWVQNLRLLHSHGAIVAANNLYDVEYIKYFTGIEPEYLPSWCDQNVLYSPTEPEVLVGPYRDNLDFPRFSEDEAMKHPIMVEMFSEANKARQEGKIVPKLVRMRSRYREYTWEQIASHPAIVLVPYQASTISFFEFYRVAIPIFCPSKRLMSKWHDEYGLMWERIYGHPSRPEFLKRSERKNPNSETKESFEDWNQFSDCYNFPHVQLYDSAEDLIRRLQTVEFFDISAKMQAFNRKQKAQLKERWSEIFAQARQRRETFRHTESSAIAHANPLLGGSNVLEFEVAVQRAFDMPAYTVPPDPNPVCQADIRTDFVPGCLGTEQAIYSPSRAHRVRLHNNEAVYEEFTGAGGWAVRDNDALKVARLRRKKPRRRGRMRKQPASSSYYICPDPRKVNLTYPPDADPSLWPEKFGTLLLVEDPDPPTPGPPVFEAGVLESITSNAVGFGRSAPGWVMRHAIGSLVLVAVSAAVLFAILRLRPSLDNGILLGKVGKGN